MKTELIYFQAFQNAFQSLGISPLVELVPIIRYHSENGWSNPLKILERFIENVKESEDGVSCETLLNRIMYYMKCEGILIKHSLAENYIWKKLIEAMESHQISLSSKITENESILNVIEETLNCSNLSEVISEMKDIIEYNDITYDSEVDSICFIVDRDQQSFTSVQYDKVLKQCQNNNFNFYVTNPCFEFWLLLHFQDIHNLDPVKLKENTNVTNKMKYTESELRKRLKGYNKNRYNAAFLISQLDTAIENEKKYCENVNELKNNIGCNIGLLINDIKTKNRY